MSDIPDIEQLIDAVLEREGGYSDHSHDRGGKTRYGITETTARLHGYSGEMRQFPLARARDIYRRIYWERPRFVDIAALAPALAAELFDIGVNMGPGTGAGFLQRALNALNRQGKDYGDLVVDRAVGPRTLAALGSFLRQRGTLGETVLLRAVDGLQAVRYIELAESRPANESFLYGWLANRIG